jgi:hypothetical protein
MTPITSVHDARRAIESFKGPAEDFLLPISDELHDPLGLNIAIITDFILAKEWEPDGFDQRDGFRVYRYKSWDQNRAKDPSRDDRVEV